LAPADRAFVQDRFGGGDDRQAAIVRGQQVLRRDDESQFSIVRAHSRVRRGSSQTDSFLGGHARRRHPVLDVQHLDPDYTPLCVEIEEDARRNLADLRDLAPSGPNQTKSASASGS